MSTGRSNRPLFDLLDGARSKPRVPLARDPLSSPSPQVEMKPRPAPVRRSSEAMDSGSRVGMLTGIKARVRPFLGDATMTLPANAVYYATAAVVLLVVVAWVIGYRSGAAKREQQLAPFTKSAPLSIQEPTQGATQRPSSPAITPSTGTLVEANRSVQLSTGTPTRANEPASGNPSVGSVSGAKPPASFDIEVSSTANPTGPGDVLLAQGWSTKDPREIGLNYLYLPIVDRAEAERAVKFLAANSLDVMAVPMKVDRRGSKGNNPPPADTVYRLVVRHGITGEEYSRDGSAKQAVQAAVARLGQVWKRDNRGTTDFSGYSWEKLVESR